MSDMMKGTPSGSYDGKDGKDEHFASYGEKHQVTTVEDYAVAPETYQEIFGYEAERNLSTNRSMFTLLFQTLSIAAIPYGIGSPLISAIYGGGQLSIFLGWIVCCILQECTALSLAELASRWPTSAGPPYWVFQLSPNKSVLLTYVTGYVWLVGNWTIALSVNFGFASLTAAAVSLYHPSWEAKDWQLLLIFYAVLAGTFMICTFGNRWLPHVDTCCAVFTMITIVVVLIALSVKADVGRHSAAYALGHYDKSFSGYGGFTWFIGLLPSAYAYSAICMCVSMAEEVKDRPEVQVPQAIAWAIPVGLVAGLIFVLPICFTMPPLGDIIDGSGGQALPYIFGRVMGTPGGGLALTVLVLVVTIFCSISITTAASRCTWAFARDNALPLSSLWKRVHPRFNMPLEALALLTIVQALLGLINLGSSTAFNSFVSVGVVSLQVSYFPPIVASMLNRRQEVGKSVYRMPMSIGWVINVMSISWILFQTVLFCMPTTLPTDKVAMNYAAVVLVGMCVVIPLAWYTIHARKVYKGPPEERF